MSHRLSLIALAAVFAVSAAFAQRIEFPRQTFDRSRFGQPAAPATLPPAAAPVRPAYSPSSVPSASPAVPTAATSTPSTSTRVPAELVESPRWDLIPHKTFDNPKDYEQLLDLQRQTGAILLVYFRNLNDSSEKGLCHWFEKHIAMTRDWQKLTRPYLKITISLPGNAAAQALAKRYGVSKTPAIFIHKPNESRPSRLAVFEWPNGEPKLIPVETVSESLLKLSNDAYRQHAETLR